MKNLQRIWYRYFVRTGFIYLLIIYSLFLALFYFVFLHYKNYLINIRVLIIFAVVILILFIIFFFRLFIIKFNEYINEYYNLTFWREKNVIYEIEILNKNGDTSIRRESNIKNVSDHGRDYKIIRIYCSDNGMDSQNLNFKSYIIHNGEKFDNLEYEIIDDRPNFKLIKIKFPHEINLYEEITYSYSFYWIGMFPKKEEWFEGTDSSDLITYIFMSDRPTNNVKIFEMNREDRVVKIHSEKASQEKVDDKYKYVLSYRKRNKYNKTKLSWEFRNSNE